MTTPSSCEQNPYPRLFAPGYIGTMYVKNRLVMPAMGAHLATEDGSANDRVIGYYAERAKGGVGLIIVEATCVHSQSGRAVWHQMLIDDDRLIPGLARLAQAIREHGARATIQLHHAGRVARALASGILPVGPSPIAAPDASMPRPLTVSEIRAIAEHFAVGAERAKHAGFDGVEIHAGHGYLISQFLSPLSNHRTDAFGGSIENRARFLVEVVDAIRTRVGKEYPVLCRLSALELGVQGGITLEETQIVAQLAERAGVDAFDISAHPFGTVAPGHRLPMEQRPGMLLSLAEGIKRAVTVPVIAVGRITPELGEMVLDEGNADFIALGRQLLADPHVPLKLSDNRPEDVVPCICCNTCIHTVWTRDQEIVCTVNPALGREREYALKPAETAKRVVVVGGGPGGMEAARVAALRGHEVTLFEQSAQLGGQLIPGAKPAFKASLEVFRRYMVRQMAMAGAHVRLAERFGNKDLSQLAPDVLVVATGTMPFVPDIPGINGEQVVLARDVLCGAQAGKRVAIIGGELVGCETAAYLAEQGKAVTILARRPELATKLNPLVRAPLLRKIEALRVVAYTAVKYEQITSAGVAIRLKTGETIVVEADTVVIAAGGRADTKMIALLQGQVPQTYCVGDCVEPGDILRAMSDGYRVGLAL